MESSKMVVPNEILMAEVARVVAAGSQARIAAKGNSMRPYVRDGSDDLVISPCDPAALRPGDFVLAKTTAGQYVAHRVIKADAETLTLKGDGNMLQTERCLRACVIGKVTQVVRGDRVYHCDKPSQRLRAALLRTSYRAWRLAKALARRIIPIRKQHI